ncbi:MAG: NAD(+)/NADH kinase [Candidatus Delongbacteria bacterium]|nr:NAD(+)/NADH kinase [Candidatus Delongbacteria bacterium]
MKYGIIDNLHRSHDKESLRNIYHNIKEKGFDVVINNENEYNKEFNFKLLSKSELIKYADVIIVLGGDGSLLETARTASESLKPFLGVNFGKLGFLADVKENEVLNCIEMIEDGKYHVEERIMLDAFYRDKKICALNDIVLDKGSSQRVMKISVDINNKYFTTYTSDGLIISTPTGSTAYNMSANGPIVQPGVTAFTITPLSPHALAMRPVVIPDSSIISITAESSDKRMILSGDGQTNIDIDTLDQVVIKKSERTAKFIKFDGSDFYMLLREKLGWGGFKERISK